MKNQTLPLAPLPLYERIAACVIIFGPFLGVMYAIFTLWNVGVGYLELGIMTSFAILTGFGVTAGFHRLLTHKSFETYRPIRWFLAICGSMAVEGPVLVWVWRHREHHTHSDTKKDPHSPNLHGSGIKGLLLGFWHAHIGWIFNAQAPHSDYYIKKLGADKGLVIINKLFPLWIVLSFSLPGIAGFVIGGDWSHAWRGFLWGGLVRIFLIHHTTWSINSICHLWGKRPFQTADLSRNNTLFGIIGLGEGWHNNHHWRLQSARHGLHWWQIDFTWYLIWILGVLGLAWKIKLPTPEEIARFEVTQ